MSGASPVDDAPGKDGYQGVTNPDAVPEPPVYQPGANPPGTNPPEPPAVDPATVPIPGMIPTFNQGQEPAPVPPRGPDNPPPEDTMTGGLGNRLP